MSANPFPTLMEAFFTERLVQQKHASAHTLASYRDTFCLLLRFAEQRLHKAPSRLTLEDLEAPLIGEFLDHLQESRGTSARTQCPPGGHPLILPICGAPSTRPWGADRTGVGHPFQAL